MLALHRMQLRRNPERRCYTSGLLWPLPYHDGLAQRLVQSAWQRAGDKQLDGARHRLGQFAATAAGYEKPIPLGCLSREPILVQKEPLIALQAGMLHISWQILDQHPSRCDKPLLLHPLQGPA